MKHNIKTLDMQLTKAISDYLEKRIAHLDKFVDSDIRESLMCYVELGKTTKHHKKGDLFKMELTINTGGKSFRAEAEESDLYASIDVATDEMSEELKSFKDKKKSLLKRGGAKIKDFLRGFYK